MPEEYDFWTRLRTHFPTAEPCDHTRELSVSIKPHELLEPYTATLPVADVAHLLAALRFFQSQPFCWVFRGQAFTGRGLQPSLERIKLPADTDRASAEEYLRYEFMRGAPQYLSRLPAEDDLQAWMALMRHHGAPSRLLDWTRSPYVAAFFAVSEPTDHATEIWVLSEIILNQLAAQRLGVDTWSLRDWLSSRKAFLHTFILEERENEHVVAALEPFEADIRMIIQQGLFLASNRLTPSEATFARALAETVHGSGGKLVLFRIEIPASLRHDILTELESMNITEATLYPGIDGFARSLRVSAEIGWNLPGLKTIRAYRPQPSRP